MHPYPAKFIPQIPQALIRHFSKAGDLVWDPMCGSGTTLVEAALADRPAIGGDLNPIAVLVARAKTTMLRDAELAEVRALAADLIAAAQKGTPTAAVPDFPNRDHWFEPHVSSELAEGLHRIEALDSENALTVARCAFSAIVVPVSNQESETRWSAKRTEAVPGRVLLRLAKRLQDSADQLEAAGPSFSCAVDVRLEDARKTSVPPESAQLVVTSPPYANSHDYYLYNKLRMFWLGYDVREVQEAEIGSRNRHSDKGESVESYLGAMADVIAEIQRKIVAGGHIAVVIGDAVIRKEFFDMGALISDLAVGLGLTLDRQISFDHRRFNSTFQRGFGTRLAKQTHVLVFQKP
ncbi:MAG TPA: DNA methyltransferase [Solirubrobacterales bacterium]|nr:DNA methyltransferase [Solirubrobacterales bacterium]